MKRIAAGVAAAAALVLAGCTSGYQLPTPHPASQSATPSIPGLPVPTRAAGPVFTPSHGPDFLHAPGSASD